MLQTITSRGWRRAIVAATGPSLTEETAALCRDSGLPVVAVNDAWRRLPWAEVLYASDDRWWRHHEGVPEFGGERWSTHTPHPKHAGNDKTEVAKAYPLNLVYGCDGDGFSLDPGMVHHGGNSGFAATNVAILMSAAVKPDPEPVEIVLVGFDMNAANGRHFFGEHPTNLRNTSSYNKFIANFNAAAKRLPKRIRIINATPASALRCFPVMKPGKVLCGPAFEAA